MQTCRAETKAAAYRDKAASTTGKYSRNEKHAFHFCFLEEKFGPAVVPSKLLFIHVLTHVQRLQFSQLKLAWLSFTKDSNDTAKYNYCAKDFLQLGISVIFVTTVIMPLNY